MKCAAADFCLPGSLSRLVWWIFSNQSRNIFKSGPRCLLLSLPCICRINPPHRWTTAHGIKTEMAPRRLDKIQEKRKMSGQPKGKDGIRSSRDMVLCRLCSTRRAGGSCRGCGRPLMLCMAMTWRCRQCLENFRRIHAPETVSAKSLLSDSVSLPEIVCGRWQWIVPGSSTQCSWRTMWQTSWSKSWWVQATPMWWDIDICIIECLEIYVNFVCLWRRKLRHSHRMSICWSPTRNHLSLRTVECFACDLLLIQCGKTQVCLSSLAVIDPMWEDAGLGRDIARASASKNAAATQQLSAWMPRWSMAWMQVSTSWNGDSSLLFTLVKKFQIDHVAELVMFFLAFCSFACSYVTDVSRRTTDEDCWVLPAHPRQWQAATWKQIASKG